jgi:hypothetical protein
MIALPPAQGILHNLRHGLQGIVFHTFCRRDNQGIVSKERLNPFKNTSKTVGRNNHNHAPYSPDGISKIFDRFNGWGKECFRKVLCVFPLLPEAGNMFRIAAPQKNPPPLVAQELGQCRSPASRPDDSRFSDVSDRYHQPLLRQLPFPVPE